MQHIFFYGKVKLGKHKELFPLFYFCPLTLTFRFQMFSPGLFVLKMPSLQDCIVEVGRIWRRGIVNSVASAHFYISSSFPFK